MYNPLEKNLEDRDEEVENIRTGSNGLAHCMVLST
jgi:hypothetical protein